MKKHLRRLRRLAPSKTPYPAIFLIVLLTASFLLGGASRLNPVALTVLSTLGAAMLVILLILPGRVASPRRYPVTFGLLIALYTVSLLQLAPLPPGIWSTFPGHGIIAEGFTLLSLEQPYLPWSLAPQDTLKGLLWFIAPTAVIILTLSVSWERVSRIARIFPLSAVIATTTFGFVQFFAGPNSPFYFHAFSNTNYPIGVFANANHQGIFLVMCMPFLAAVAGRWRQKWRAGTTEAGRLYIIALIIIWTVLAIVAAGSLASYILGVVIGLMSSVLVLGKKSTLNTGVLTTGLVVLAVVVLTTFTSPLLEGLGQGSYFGDGLARSATHERTITAIKDHMPMGSGLGSFEKVFKTYEEPNEVTRTFMNHAHGDYLEFVLEFGVFGVLLLCSFLIWFMTTFIYIWSGKFDAEGERLRKAASLAIAALLIHSLVDYPVRTAAIACFAAFSVAVMIYRPPASGSRHEVWRRTDSGAGPSSQAPKHEEL